MGKDGLSPADPILGLAVRIKREWAKKAISKAKCGKAVEMMKASGVTDIDLVT